MISVIVPVFNTEKYISRCITSIISQTYSDFELILVNDGSTDSSREIIQDFVKRDFRIKLIDKLNGGLSDARNTGIKNVSGDFLTFIDSDDWIHENYLETLLGCFDSDNVDIAIINYIKTDKINYIKETSTSNDFVNINRFRLLELLDGPLHTLLTVSWGKLYRKRLFEKISFPYGKIHEDEYTSYRLYFLSNEIVIYNKILYYYFQHSESIMASSDSDKSISDAIEALIERHEFYELNGLNNLIPGLEFKMLGKLYEITRNKVKKDSESSSLLNNIRSTILLLSVSNSLKIKFLTWLHENLTILFLLSYRLIKAISNRGKNKYEEILN